MHIVAAVILRVPQGLKPKKFKGDECRPEGLLRRDQCDMTDNTGEAPVRRWLPTALCFPSLNSAPPRNTFSPSVKTQGR